MRNVSEVGIMSGRPRLVEEGLPLTNATVQEMINCDYLGVGQRDASRSTLSQQIDPVEFSVVREPSRLKKHFVISAGQSAGHESMLEQQEYDMDIDHHHERASLAVGPGSGLYDNNFYDINDEVTHMEGIEAGDQLPLVVFDGANVAYAYSEAKASLFESQGLYSKSSLSSSRYGNKRQPDIEGINIAVNHFLGTSQCRVMVVLPAYWLRVKPSDSSRDNAKMQTPQLDSLQELKNKGLLCCAPPKDDDDAYIISIARRSDSKAKARGGGGSFILSNDMYRDAIERDNNMSGLKEWLNENNLNHQGPARISYAFCDLGAMNEFGSRILDFVPNPSHPFISYLEDFQKYR